MSLHQFPQKGSGHYYKLVWGSLKIQMFGTTNKLLIQDGFDLEQAT